MRSRLVGWWLAAVFTAGSARVAHAQSTATFPEEPTPAPAQPGTAPAARTPTATPSAKPALPPPGATVSGTTPDEPYTPRLDPTYAAPGLPPPGPDVRPPILPYEDGLPVPPGYEVVSRPATGLIAGGLIGMASAYGVGLIVGATQGFKNGAGWLFAPVIGPWIAIGTRKYECKTGTGSVAEAKGCVNSAVGEVQLITFMAVDGIAQLATGFVALAGLMTTREQLLRTDLLSAKINVIPPGPGHDGWEITARGEF